MHRSASIERGEREGELRDDNLGEEEPKQEIRKEKGEEENRQSKNR